jgi:hypothetical protein
MGTIEDIMKEARCKKDGYYQSINKGRTIMDVEIAK